MLRYRTDSHWLKLGTCSTNRTEPVMLAGESMGIHIEKNRGDSRYKVIMRDHTVTRLSTTCFRGPSVASAGNFSAWTDARVFLHDVRILDKIISEMREIPPEERRGSHSFEIEFDQSVGWSSTDELWKFPEEHLEEFPLNRRAVGLRVIQEDGNYLAPKTNLVTIIFELKDEGNSLVAIVHSVYPGEDVGELFGNVSARENVAYFDWTHPGEK